MQINKDRVVEISRNGVSWRQFGAELLTNSKIKSAEDRFLNAFQVKNNIFLLMDNGTPKYSTSNKFTAGLDDLVQTAGKAVDNLVSGTKLGKFLQGVGATLTGLASIGLDIGANITGGEGTAFNPWWLDAPTWNGTRNTMSFDYTFNFAMGQYGLWEAKEEVVKPILSLAMPSMIKNITNNTMTGPGPRTFDLLRGTFGWDEIGNLFKNGLGSNIIDECGEYLYNFQFGNFLSLTNVLVKNTDMVFSSEVDTDRMPIAGSITLHCATFVPQAISANSNKLISMRFHNIP